MVTKASPCRQCWKDGQASFGVMKFLSTGALLLVRIAWVGEAYGEGSGHGGDSPPTYDQMSQQHSARLLGSREMRESATATANSHNDGRLEGWPPDLLRKSTPETLREAPNGTSSPNLNSLISISELLATRPPTHTIGNVNFIGTNNASTLGHIAICYLPYLMRFTYDGFPVNSIGSYDGLAAISLAMEHLNTGNGSIVPEIHGIHDRCPLRFATRAFDTKGQQSVAIDHVITLTDRSASRKGLLPCGIIGAARSSVSIPTSIISGLRGFPQISPISTSASLDDKVQHKYFGRTIPNDDGTAIPLLAKLNSWGVGHVAVLHVNDAYGNGFANGIRYLARKEYPKMRVETVAITTGADGEAEGGVFGYKISEAVQKLKETGFRYIFGIMYSSDVDEIMMEAYDQGIAGTGQHTWLFGDGVGTYFAEHPIPAGSPLEKAYRGTGMLSAAGGVPGMDLFDKFTRSMRQLGGNEEDLSHLYAHLPQGFNHSIVTGQKSFLKTPGLIAPFLYDAVVALGLAACGLVENSETDEYFAGEEQFRAFVNTTFVGTSGPIVFDRNTGTRDPSSALFLLTNFVVDEEANVDGGMMRFKGVETDLFRSGKWESLLPYTFGGGAGEIPLDLPAYEINSNYLGSTLRVVGSILCAFIMLLSLGFSCWTYRNSKTRVVRASQPIFLHIISAGAFLMGLAIIPLTIDLGVADQRGASTACMSFPWLLTIGFSLTFSALFTKTYRINRIMRSASRFKRLKLTPADVIKPMVALLMLNMIILTIWTAVDPIQHHTDVIDRDQYLRDIETIGICKSESGPIFGWILLVINLGSLLFAVVQAYRAQNISTELQESNYIFGAMALILLAFFMGVPVIIIARNNQDAFFFVTVGIIFVVCASILLLIFGPKVHALWLETHDVLGATSGGVDGIGVLNEALRNKELENACGELRESQRTLKHENSKLQNQMMISTNNIRANAAVEEENEVLKQRIDELERENQKMREFLSRYDKDLAHSERGGDYNDSRVGNV